MDKRLGVLCKFIGHQWYYRANQHVGVALAKHFLRCKRCGHDVRLKSVFSGVKLYQELFRVTKGTYTKDELFQDWEG